ncbi:MAG TPA: hypothetical protein DEA44_01800 [Firmicutes bacterium]|nr:hypothetical protein [Bacillota bacterium]
MRKKVKILMGLAALVICLLALTGAAAAMSFSAEIVSYDAGETTTAKFWMTDNKMRTEQDGMATILRMDKKLMWVLMLEDGMYMEYPFNPSTPKYQQSQVATAEPATDETERVWILNELVNTYRADKYRVNYRNQPSHYIWMSADPGLLMEVKSAALDNSWWREFRKISLAAPAPALFEIPPGFKKMAMQGLPNFIR